MWCHLLVATLITRASASEEDGTTTIVNHDALAFHSVSSDEFLSNLVSPLPSMPNVPRSPPLPPPPLPGLALCDNIHVSPESKISNDGKGGSFYRVHLKIWVARWVPGGRFRIVWTPAMPTVYGCEGARVVPVSEYTQREAQEAAATAMSVLELPDRIHLSGCNWADPRLSGGGCVLLDASIESEESPHASPYCAPGGSTSTAYLAELEAAFDSQGCALDEEPLDGYSRVYDPSLKSSEVHVLLRSWKPGGIVSMFWPGAADLIELQHVQYNVAPTEEWPMELWGGKHLGTRKRKEPVAGVEMLFELGAFDDKRREARLVKQGWREDYPVRWAKASLDPDDEGSGICLEPPKIATPDPPPPPPPPSPPPPPLARQALRQKERTDAETRAKVGDGASRLVGGTEYEASERYERAADLAAGKDPHGQAACFFGFKASHVPMGHPIIRCKASMPPSPPPPPPSSPPPSPVPSPPLPLPPPHVLMALDRTACPLGGFVQTLLEGPLDAPPSQQQQQQQQPWRQQQLRTDGQAEAARRWFTVALVFDVWQPSTRVTLSLAGNGLQLVKARNADYITATTSLGHGTAKPSLRSSQPSDERSTMATTMASSSAIGASSLAAAPSYSTLSPAVKPVAVWPVARPSVGTFKTPPVAAMASATDHDAMIDSALSYDGYGSYDVPTGTTSDEQASERKRAEEERKRARRRALVEEPEFKPEVPEVPWEEGDQLPQEQQGPWSRRQGAMEPHQSSGARAPHVYISHVPQRRVDATTPPTTVYDFSLRLQAIEFSYKMPKAVYLRFEGSGERHWTGVHCGMEPPPNAPPSPTPPPSPSPPTPPPPTASLPMHAQHAMPFSYAALLVLGLAGVGSAVWVKRRTISEAIETMHARRGATKLAAIEVEDEMEGFDDLDDLDDEADDGEEDYADVPGKDAHFGRTSRVGMPLFGGAVMD